MTTEDQIAYQTNAKVFSGGLDKHQVKNYYDSWDGYDKDLAPGRYNGPYYAAEAIDRSFPKFKDRVSILDVAAGTGFLGEELAQRGFRHIDALDPSEGMLRKAKKKKVYEKFFCEFLTEDELPIDNGTYDCVTCVGGFGDGHIPVESLKELIRITKPGGLVVIVMREEYLNQVADYKDKFEPYMTELQNQGLWYCIEKSVVNKYFCDKHGVIFRHRVLHRHL